MEKFFRHLPFSLIVFLVLSLGLTDLALHLAPGVLLTLLAPILWLGVYWLGAPRVVGEA